MPGWFDGGEDGLGQGVRIEIWGGETLPSGEPITFNQLYFSQISMTNRAQGDATLTLFYPST